MVCHTLVPIELDGEAKSGREVHAQLPFLGVPDRLGLKVRDCRHRCPPVAVPSASRLKFKPIGAWRESAGCAGPPC